MNMVIGIIVASLLMLVLAATVVSGLRDKRLYIVTAFDLRTLPHGEQFDLGDGTSRLFSIVDAQIAFEGYQEMDSDKRRWFTSMYDFILYVAESDSSLLDVLRVREVDPAEYEMDRTGWEDEDEDDDDWNWNHDTR